MLWITPCSSTNCSISAVNDASSTHSDRITVWSPVCWSQREEKDR
ncbi:MAG: hypothetical protein ACOC9P_01770 [bacterium]